MIVVKVELHSARTGRITSLGEMVIDNVGVRGNKADYRTRTFRKGQPAVDALVRRLKPIREGEVKDHARHALPVWTLVGRALAAMGFVHPSC